MIDGGSGAVLPTSNDVNTAPIRTSPATNQRNSSSPVDLYSQTLLKKNQKRGKNGRFESINPENPLSIRRHQKRQSRRVTQMNAGMRFFRKLVDILFLQGNDDPSKGPVDWITGERRGNHLIHIATKSFKSVYLPNKIDMHREMIYRYFNFDHSKSCNNLKLMTVRAFGAPFEERKRLRVFIGRRLPSIDFNLRPLSEATVEIEKVHAWISEGIEKGMFRLDGKNEVFNIIKEVLASYRLEDGKLRYIGYPKKDDDSDQNDEKHSNEDIDANRTDNDANIVTTSVANPTVAAATVSISTADEQQANGPSSSLAENRVTDVRNNSCTCRQQQRSKPDIRIIVVGTMAEAIELRKRFTDAGTITLEYHNPNSAGV